MKDIVITTINPSNKERFYRLAKEYLPYSDYDKVMDREKEYSKAYVALMTENEVIGVAFGWPRRLDVPEDMSLTLDGIAVTEAYQKNGYGSMLLNEIENAAKLYSCPSVSLGSAGEYVEKFCINN